MNELTEARKTYIKNLPSSHTSVDFINDIKSVEERAYWFQKNRIEGWLLKDTRCVVEKGESMLGLAALIFIGIETLSSFTYGYKVKSLVRFPKFLEEYVDKSFSIERETVIDFKEFNFRDQIDFEPEVNPTDSLIFYKGMRNSLMHSFSFKSAELRMPMVTFKRWEPSKKVLRIDARRLLIKFEDSVHKYMRKLWNSNPNDDIYENFKEMFERSFVN